MLIQYRAGRSISECIERARQRRVKRQAKRRELSGVRGAMTKTAIKTALRTMFSAFIRLRDIALHGNNCQIGQACRGQGVIECAYHLVPVADGSATAYDPDNAVGSCDRCNAAEKRYRPAYRLLHIQLFGKGLIERLEAKAAAGNHYTSGELLALRDRFRDRIKRGEWR